MDATTYTLRSDWGLRGGMEDVETSTDREELEARMIELQGENPDETYDIIDNSDDSDPDYELR